MVARLNLPADVIAGQYLSGWSEKRLADSYGCGRHAIRRRLLEAGISPRGRSAAEKLKWSQMSAKRRLEHMRPAHTAALGRELTIETKSKAAKTREGNPTACHISPIEIEVAKELLAHGIATKPQTAVGPYNCDLTAEPVAVEIWGGHWHFSGHHKRRFPKRTRHILGAGWHLYILPVTVNDPLTDQRIDDIAAYIERCRINPSMRREYRVVWCTGKWELVGTLEDNEISLIPPFTGRRNPTTTFYERIAR